MSGLRRAMTWLIMGGLVIAAADVAHAQGLYWENQTTAAGEKTRTAQIYAMPKKMKIVSNGGGIIIIRGDQEKLYTVTPAKKTYMVFTFAELEATAKTARSAMQAAMERMQKQIKDLPPDKRAKVEKLLHGIAGSASEQASAVEVKRTGETKSVSGYASTRYVATANGKTVLSAWTTPDVKGFAALRDDWLAYQRRMIELNRGVAGEIIEAYAKIAGFPMETEIGRMKTVVTKIEPRNIPPSEFEVPAGYRQEKIALPQPQGKEPDRPAGR